MKKKEIHQKEKIKQSKKRKKRFESQSLYLTFENIKKYMSRKKYATVYDKRELKLDSFNYGQFARMTLRKLESERFRYWYFNAPSNTVRILLDIYFARSAFKLTQKLSDEYIIMKEMIVDIEKNMTKKDQEYFDKCIKEGAEHSFCGFYDFSNETTPENYVGWCDGLYKL